MGIMMGRTSGEAVREETPSYPVAFVERFFRFSSHRVVTKRGKNRGSCLSIQTFLSGRHGLKRGNGSRSSVSIFAAILRNVL